MRVCSIDETSAPAPFKKGVKQKGGSLEEEKLKKVQVGVLMGSDSDMPVMEKTLEVLKGFKVAYEVKILSAHRSPDETVRYAKSAKRRGLKVIIAGAGGAAHLAGVLASHTTLPVIGVPMETKSLKGIDSLLSISQMPAGVPVATMAIGEAGAKNAAYFALTVLGTRDVLIERRLKGHRLKMRESVRLKNKRLKDIL